MVKGPFWAEASQAVAASRGRLSLNCILKIGWSDCYIIFVCDLNQQELMGIIKTFRLTVGQEASSFIDRRPKHLSLRRARSAKGQNLHIAKDDDDPTMVAAMKAII